MQRLWCWRCGAVNMLDEDEFRLVWGQPGIEAAQPGWDKQAWAKGLLERHEQLTGERYTDIGEIQNHRLSRQGPPCKQCTKPLRSPTAKFCAACGHRPA